MLKNIERLILKKENRKQFFVVYVPKNEYLYPIFRIDSSLLTKKEKEFLKNENNKFIRSELICFDSNEVSSEFLKESLNILSKYEHQLPKIVNNCLHFI